MEHTNDDLALALPLFPLSPQGVTPRTWRAFVVWVVFRDHYYDALVCRMMGLVDQQELARWEQVATWAAEGFLRRALDDWRVDSFLQEVENDLGL